MNGPNSIAKRAPDVGPAPADGTGAGLTRTGGAAPPGGSTTISARRAGYDLVDGHGRGVSAALAVEEAAHEAAHPLQPLLAGVDDRLFAVVVRVVLRVGIAGDLGLHVVQHDAPHLAADVLDVDLRPLEHQPSDLPGLVDQHHAVGLRRDD